MSIKQNITNLQNLLAQVNALPEAENFDIEISTQSTLLSEQDTKIAELAEILNSKATSGGISIKTCTVNISTTGKDYGFGSEYGTIVYTAFENGKMVAKRLDGVMTSLSINAVCGSFLLINESHNRVSHSFFGLEALEGPEFNPFEDGRLWCFYITASADETATLTIEMD